MARFGLDWAFTLLPIGCSALMSVGGVPAQATSLSETEQALIHRCRVAASDATRNPSATGSWLIDMIEGQNSLCLYGSGKWGDLNQLLDTFDKRKITQVGVRSTGGPVGVWLSIAERLAAHVHMPRRSANHINPSL